MNKAKVGHRRKDFFERLGAEIPEGNGGVIVIAAGNDIKVPGDLENCFALFFDDGAEALFFRRIVLATITVVVKFSVFEKGHSKRLCPGLKLSAGIVLGTKSKEHLVTGRNDFYFGKVAISLFYFRENFEVFFHKRKSISAVDLFVGFYSVSVATDKDVVETSMGKSREVVFFRRNTESSEDHFEGFRHLFCDKGNFFGQCFIEKRFSKTMEVHLSLEGTYPVEDKLKVFHGHDPLGAGVLIAGTHDASKATSVSVFDAYLLEMRDASHLIF